MSLEFGIYCRDKFVEFIVFLKFWMSSSSVMRASHRFMADERMRQSMKSVSMFLSLKAVSGSVLSCVGIVVIVSLWTMLMLLMEISCPFLIV